MLCNALSMFQDTAPGLKRSHGHIRVFKNAITSPRCASASAPSAIIHSAAKPRLLLATDRHDACGNAHASCRVGHKSPRGADQFGDSSAPSKDLQPAHWPCLYAFSLPPLEPLGEGSPCIRQRPACTTEVIAPTPSVTIICGRYCADSPPA